MLKASGEGKRRIVALFAFVGATLGLTALAGLAQRKLAAPPIPEPPPLKIRTPEEQKQRRALIKKIRDLGRKKDWKGVIAATAPECAGEEGCSPLVRSAYLEASLRSAVPGMAERFTAPLRESIDTVAQASALGFLNQREAYIRHVEGMLAPLDSEKATAMEANNTAWAAVLMPGPPPQPEKVLALAERGVALAAPEERPNFTNTLGVVFYRLERYADAITTLTETEKRFSEPLNWPFLALAHQRLGNTKEAQMWATRYRTFMDDSFGAPERNRVEPLLFQRELDEALPVKKN